MSVQQAQPNVELNSQLISTAIRVIIVPIDEMSEATFAKYRALIQRCFADCELRALTQSSKKAASDELTAHRSRQEARIVFDYVDYAHYQASVWADLHLQRRVLGVVGVFHCRSGNSLLSAASNAFAEVLQKFPTSLASICFAFEPLEQQPDLDRAGGDVVLVPNSVDDSRLPFYVTTLMQDFAARLLSQLEATTLNDDFVPFIATPIDSNPRTADEIARLKKRKPNRMAKTKGDAALLLGSPEDALSW